jgi:hypothetical protein
MLGLNRFPSLRRRRVDEGSHRLQLPGWFKGFPSSSLSGSARKPSARGTIFGGTIDNI